MSNFKSMFWTPNSEINSSNFQQLIDNDDYIYNKLSKLNYGGFYESISESINIDFDPKSTKFLFYGQEADGASAGTVINVHSDQEIWKFGVLIPNVTMEAQTTTSAFGAIVANGSLGMQIDVQAVDLNVNPNTKKIIGIVMNNPDYIEYKKGHCIEGTFCYKFPKPGVYLINYYANMTDPANNMINIVFGATKTSNGYVYAKCLGEP